eukprot:1154088-Pelagomonas_calceolata.AAC.15
MRPLFPTWSFWMTRYKRYICTKTGGGVGARHLVTIGAHSCSISEMLPVSELEKEVHQPKEPLSGR